MPDYDSSLDIFSGDISFLSKKEFDNKRVDVNGSLTLNNTIVETDLVTQIATGGKDMYLAAASINGTATSVNVVLSATYRLFINGVEKDKFSIRDPMEGDEWDYKFIIQPVKVTTGQIIKITAQNGIAQVNAITIQNGKLVLWEEDTGVDPSLVD